MTFDNSDVAETFVISINTPTKGVTGKLDVYNNPIQHFNQHSHEGSDSFDNSDVAETFVISINTPTKGVTSTFTDTRYTCGHFNQHSHEGSDE